MLKLKVKTKNKTLTPSALNYHTLHDLLQLSSQLSVLYLLHLLYPLSHAVFSFVPTAQRETFFKATDNPKQMVSF